MRILNREAFMRCPEGTVFFDYKPHHFGSLSVKTCAPKPLKSDEEVFRGRSQSPQDTRKTVPWYAKVRMSDGSLKTFRLTSITPTGEKP